MQSSSRLFYQYWYRSSLFLFELSSCRCSHVSALFTGEGREKQTCDFSGTFATHSGHVYDITDTDCCTQDGSALACSFYDITDGDTDCCTQDGNALACCVYDITDGDTDCWTQDGNALACCL